MAKIESALARINASQKTYRFSLLWVDSFYYLYRYPYHYNNYGVGKTVLASWSHHWTKECVASIERLEREISAGNLEWAPRDNS